MEILTTFRVEYISALKIHFKMPFKPMARKPPIPPLPIGECGAPSNTPIQWLTLFTTPKASRQTDRQNKQQTDGSTDGIGNKSVPTPAYTLLIV